MKKLYFLLLTFIMTITSVSSQEREALVLLKTEFGDIKLKLYNDTPRHRDNFLKLIKEGFYKDLLFHRVIEHFMIQGGDPTSRIAEDSVKIGSGDLGYTIPAEIVYPKYFHKKGALAAARTGNNVNPNRESSSSQFYIVTGKKLSEKDLNNMEKTRIERMKQEIYNKLQAENKSIIKEFYSSGDLDGLAAFRQGLYTRAGEEAQNSKATFTDEQRRLYQEIGGAPHLDGEYTVFGEVIDGFEVLDEIEKVKTDSNDRPKKEIKMDMVILEDYKN